MVLDLDVPTDHTPFCIAKWDVDSKIRFYTTTIKVTHSPCLFWLPPWQNVNRSTTLFDVPFQVSFRCFDVAAWYIDKILWDS